MLIEIGILHGSSDLIYYTMQLSVQGKTDSHLIDRHVHSTLSIWSRNAASISNFASDFSQQGTHGRRLGGHSRTVSLDGSYPKGRRSLSRAQALTPKIQGCQGRFASQDAHSQIKRTNFFSVGGVNQLGRQILLKCSKEPPPNECLF